MKDNIYNNIQCRYAQSLGGGFELHPNKVWNTIDYVDKTKPVVFCGLYDARDYYALWRHKGKVWIFWCGGDLNNLDRGFVLNDGKLRWISRMPFFKPLLVRLLKKAEHWVENCAEEQILKKYGIISNICQSFFGDINKFKLSYFWSKTPNVYISCGIGRQIEYGFDVIERIAPKLPHVWFHLYGDTWETKQPNIIVHGRLPIFVMNEQIKNMQCGLRLNEIDGFSEITAKCVLMGQYPITKIPYPLIINYKTEDELIEHIENLRKTYRPNKGAQKYYQYVLNKFPWNKYVT